MAKKWYYVEYETFGLENEFEANSAVEAEQMALEELRNGIDIIVEEMEE